MSSEWMRPELIWFVVGLVLLVLEFILPGLIIFFFGVGAWAVSIVCFFADIPINAQLLIFIVVSVLSLVLLRKKVNTVFVGRVGMKPAEPGEFDEFVGKKAVVVSAISPESGGRVELNGTAWRAESDESIAEGETVLIESHENLTLKVNKLKGRS